MTKKAKNTESEQQETVVFIGLTTQQTETLLQYLMNLPYKMNPEPMIDMIQSDSKILHVNASVLSNDEE